MRMLIMQLGNHKYLEIYVISYMYSDLAVFHPCTTAFG